MELSQKFTFSTKKYRYVANRPEADFPDTVLLFEPRISYPALRVTKINFYLNFDRLSTNLIQIWWKIDFHENFEICIFWALRMQPLRHILP